MEVCTQLGIIYRSITHPLDSTHTVDFSADIPHLLKNIILLLFNKHFTIIANVQKYKPLSPIIDLKHLNKMVDFKEGMDLKYPYKLTSEHLDKKLTKRKFQEQHDYDHSCLVYRNY